LQEDFVITLYDYLPSQNAWKVRQLLRHLAIPHRTEIISIFEGAGQSPQYLAINPWGAVPARYVGRGVGARDSWRHSMIGLDERAAGVVPAAGVEDVSEATHLQRTFKNVVGISPKAFHDAARLCLLKGALRAGKSVLESITEAGFHSTSRVYGHAMRNLGMTPSAYREGGEGETIAYAYRDSALGSLVMAATNRGVC
jgi:hypothetical protein